MKKFVLFTVALLMIFGSIPITYAYDLSEIHEKKIGEIVSTVEPTYRMGTLGDAGTRSAGSGWIYTSREQTTVLFQPDNTPLLTIYSKAKWKVDHLSNVVDWGTEDFYYDAYVIADYNTSSSEYFIASDNIRMYYTVSMDSLLYGSVGVYHIYNLHGDGRYSFREST